MDKDKKIMHLNKIDFTQSVSASATISNVDTLQHKLLATNVTAGSTTATQTASQSWQLSYRDPIRITVREEANNLFENAKDIAKIRLAEFLRYSHEQFLVY